MCSDGSRTHVFISPSHGFYLEEGGGNEWLALMRRCNHEIIAILPALLACLTMPAIAASF